LTIWSLSGVLYESLRRDRGGCPVETQDLASLHFHASLFLSGHGCYMKIFSKDCNDETFISSIVAGIRHVGYLLRAQWGTVACARKTGT